MDRLKSKIVFLVSILVIGFSIPSYIYASNGGVVGSTASSGDNSGDDLDCNDDYGCINFNDPTEDLIQQICEFRQMFCGGVAIILVSLVFIFIGILTLMQKINWGFVLVMITASIVFVQADRFAAMFAPGAAIECSC